MKDKRLNTEQFTAGIDPRVVQKGKKEVEKKANALQKLVITYIPTDKVMPNLWNPNRQDPHAFELLLKSMSEDGFTQPIVVVKVTAETMKDAAFAKNQLGDTVVVDGEHRWRAAQHLGLAEVPVVYTDMTPEQMRIATLRHNRARGDEDLELTAQVLKDLRELGALDWAADSLMMDDVELDKLLNDVPAPEALAGAEFSEAWTPEKPGAGDVNAGHTVDGTPAALLKAREQEAAVAAAKTEEERAAIKRDNNIYRLALMFSGEEAVIVKKALGEKPAVKLVEWAKAHLAPHESEEAEAEGTAFGALEGDEAE
jgi:ParB/RepB/Spo0J family partition protein